MGLFSRELIFGGAFYWKEFCVSKWVDLDNKNSLYAKTVRKEPKTACTKSLWAYIREGLLGLIIDLGGYFLEGLFVFWGRGEGLIIGILRYHDFS